MISESVAPRRVVAAHCTLWALLLAGAVSTASGQTFAPIYGIRHTAPPEIWSIDLTTGAATFVTSNLSKTKVACARHPQTGQVWLFSNVTPNKISAWDPATDVETTIAAGPNVQFHRVGFDAAGNLYGVPLNSNALYSIDTTTGAVTNLGGMKGVNSGGDGGDLAFAPGETRKFCYFSSARYYEVDVATLQGTLINNDVGFKTTGAACTADGRLWVSSDTDFYECDPSTGVMTLVGSLGMQQILDLTEDLSPLHFGVDPLDPAPNATVDLSAKQGLANGPLLLALTAISGSPTFVNLGVFTFDGAGAWTMQAVVPPGLTGLDADVEVIGFAESGDLLITNVETIAFQ